jgi:hypothetical protein
MVKGAGVAGMLKQSAVVWDIKKVGDVKEGA